MTLSDAFGEGPSFEFGPQKIALKWRDIDLNDWLEFEDRYGELDNFDLDTMEQLRFFMWLFLRKCDPSLTADDIAEERWKLSEKACGRVLSGPVMKWLKSQDGMELIRKILVSAGMMVTTEETPEGNG